MCINADIRLLSGVAEWNAKLDLELWMLRRPGRKIEILGPCAVCALLANRYQFYYTEIGSGSE